MCPGVHFSLFPQPPSSFAVHLESDVFSSCPSGPSCLLRFSPLLCPFDSSNVACLVSSRFLSVEAQRSSQATTKERQFVTTTFAELPHRKAQTHTHDNTSKQAQKINIFQKANDAILIFSSAQRCQHSDRDEHMCSVEDFHVLGILIPT
jgi:hypothetical protein